MTSSKWTAQDLPNLENRTFVVTGANSGIGLVAARALGGAGARVVLAVRDTAKGEQAAASIEGSTEVRELDLADLASVRAFADAWDGDIDVLVNNAGVMAVPERRTEGRLRDADRHQPPRPLRAHEPAAAEHHRPCRDHRVGRPPRGIDPTRRPQLGAAAATTAGAPTASRSSPTCCSRPSCSAGSRRPDRASARSPRTRAGPPRTSRTAPRACCRTRSWRSATG